MTCKGGKEMKKKKTKFRIVNEEFGTKPMKEAFEEAFAPYFRPREDILGADIDKHQNDKKQNPWQGVEMVALWLLEAFSLYPLIL